MVNPGASKFQPYPPVESDASHSWKTIGRKLNEVCSHVQRAVQIGAYSRRFEADPDPQSPSEEFVLLLYLLGESDQPLSKGDLDWINQEVPVPVADLTKQLSASDKVRRTIRDNLPPEFRPTKTVAAKTKRTRRP